MSTSFWDHPIATIEKALEIRKKIEALQQSLDEIYGSVARHVTSQAAPKAVDGRKGKRSPAARAKMAAAQKARWAKAKAKPAIAVNGAKKKRTMSPEGRARIAAAQKARWAKQKAA